jgi:hypothetical protein
MQWTEPFFEEGVYVEYLVSRMLVEVVDAGARGNYRVACAALTPESLAVVAEQIGPQLRMAVAKAPGGGNLWADGHASSRLEGRWIGRGRCDCALMGRACASCGMLYGRGRPSWFVNVTGVMYIKEQSVDYIIPPDELIVVMIE